MDLDLDRDLDRDCDKDLDGDMDRDLDGDLDKDLYEDLHVDKDLNCSFTSWKSRDWVPPQQPQFMDPQQMFLMQMLQQMGGQEEFRVLTSYGILESLVMF